MATNTLDIQVNHIINKRKKTAGFAFVIKIDGKPINEKHHVDLYEIAQVITHPKRTYIHFWNCDCGIPECANIEASNIKATKNKDQLMILSPIPCSTNDFEDKSYSYWEKHHKIMVMRLDIKEVARKLWDLTFELEKAVEMYSKEYFMTAWPATTNYYEYEWPSNLPIEIRTTLIKGGFKF
jgi:hypothetical protein